MKASEVERATRQTSAVTITEVAAQADVSTATVSRVLSGSRAVANRMRDRVLATVAKLDYHPNRLARDLQIHPRVLRHARSPQHRARRFFGHT